MLTYLSISAASSIRALQAGTLGERRKKSLIRCAAYIQLARYIHGFLGRNVRKRHPCCCVAAIRNAYRDPRDRYKGFYDPTETAGESGSEPDSSENESSSGDDESSNVESESQDSGEDI